MSRNYDIFDSEHFPTKEKLYGKETKYSNINWKNRETEKGVVIQEGTPIPREIAEYYAEHGYAEKWIPLNADTCREIAKILDLEDDRMVGG